MAPCMPHIVASCICKGHHGHVSNGTGSLEGNCLHRWRRAVEVVGSRLCLGFGMCLPSLLFHFALMACKTLSEGPVWSGTLY